MIQQIVVIGGGTGFDSYKDYISYLKNHEINLEKLRPHRDWKDTLPEKLGKNFDVLFPRMPNATYARYKEWKIWLERIIPLLDKEIIFVGHSMGGIFLVKYMSENTVPRKIKATILVAAPFDYVTGRESLDGFTLQTSLKKFEKQSKTIYLIQSKDDPSVPFEELDKYKKTLPNAKTLIFNDRGHFRQETFPEIVKLIRSL